MKTEAVRSLLFIDVSSSEGRIKKEVIMAFCFPPVQARVLFLHPTSLKMKPCEFFLEGRCKFEDKCRQSHGHLVPMAELREYV
jgi:hypothetical protein